MSRDNIVPRDKWAFDEDVAKCFPDMLKRSIPAYESMRSLVFFRWQKLCQEEHAHL